MSRLIEQPGVFLTAVAARAGLTFDKLHAAAQRRPMWLQPGKIVEGEKPLPIGSIVNLRRELPGGRWAHKDPRWTVAGYRQDSRGRWNGYELIRGEYGFEQTILGRCEAFDLVERYQVLTT